MTKTNLSENQYLLEGQMVCGSRIARFDSIMGGKIEKILDLLLLIIFFMYWYAGSTRVLWT